MATGPRLKAYLALERAMVDLDDAGDPVGDELRDRMDPIWLKLSDEERAALDGRTGDASAFAGTVARDRDAHDILSPSQHHLRDSITVRIAA